MHNIDKLLLKLLEDSKSFMQMLSPTEQWVGLTSHPTHDRSFLGWTTTGKTVPNIAVKDLNFLDYLAYNLWRSEPEGEAPSKVG